MKDNILCKIMGTVVAIVSACVFAVFSASTVLAQTTCVDISRDLSSGVSDSVSDSSVLQLQNYLRSLGYLVAVPTGYFGSATLSAVKEYQTVTGISATGYVGTRTRASISQKTCPPATAASNTAAVSVTQTSVSQSPVSVAIPAPTVTNTNVTSPVTGQLLSVGSSTVIRWNNSVSNNYNISLEQPGGTGEGFIAMDQSPNTSGNQYLWSVGKIYSTQTNSYQTIAPGTYRIRLGSSSGGTLPTDAASGWFTIIAPQFTVSSLTPASALADNASSVVLFGSGLNSSVSIYFDADYSGIHANNQYISPDGKLIVFTVPTTVTAGQHTLYIDNGQGSSPLSLPFVVSSLQ